MTIYQVRQVGDKLLKWEKEKNHKEMSRVFILVSEEEIQRIQKNEFLKSDYKGEYYLTQNQAEQELMLNQITNYFKTQFDVTLERKTYCFAEFDFNPNYSGAICTGNQNQFNVTFSKLESTYGHIRERLQWEKWFPLTKEGLDLLSHKINETVQ
ncbi:hypothetical protein [Carnobacterium divergens]|uniref:Uncharacterized protein n=1 Tax=Carnobacterium divergens TaxID=2748 RepID=A0AAW8RB21_CARDV|nr:hypothetical protein [Carnobacterium divergens]MDT1958991.1 hypothetical protein [Carnobacterium divergens]MDT1974959.1 hypothetical protein [Carnobacterium divergens]MDT2012923.1 hypothetical protein [Carnobacterium divergens]